MIKSLMIASVLFVALSVPAFAGSGGCDDNDAWTATEAEINGLADGDEKDAALAEWKMSGEFKASSNMNECDNHMKMAREHMGKGKKK